MLWLLLALFHTAPAPAAEPCDPVGRCRDENGLATAGPQQQFSGPTNEELVRRYDSYLARCGCGDLVPRARESCRQTVGVLFREATSVLNGAALASRAPARLQQLARNANTVTVSGVVTAEEQRLLTQLRDLNRKTIRLGKLGELACSSYGSIQARIDRDSKGTGVSPADAVRMQKEKTCFNYLTSEVGLLQKFVKRECEGSCAQHIKETCAQPNTSPATNKRP